jgi:hypothetical protein
MVKGRAQLLRFGRSQSNRSETSQRVRLSWTDEDIRHLKLLADQNVSADSIAKSLERSVGSVKLKARWLNLSLARRLKAKGHAG